MRKHFDMTCPFSAVTFCCVHACSAYWHLSMRWTWCGKGGQWQHLPAALLNETKCEWQERNNKCVLNKYYISWRSCDFNISHSGGKYLLIDMATIYGGKYWVKIYRNNTLRFVISGFLGEWSHIWVNVTAQCTVITYATTPHLFIKKVWPIQSCMIVLDNMNRHPSIVENIYRWLF